MIRLALWIVVSLLVTAAIAWLISLPGTLTIELLGFRMQPRLGIAAFATIGAIFLIIGLWGILRRVLGVQPVLSAQHPRRHSQANRPGVRKQPLPGPIVQVGGGSRLGRQIVGCKPPTGLPIVKRYLLKHGHSPMWLLVSNGGKPDAGENRLRRRTHWDRPV